jgi:hypothetical protein
VIKQASYRVGAKVVAVAKQQVACRAAFDADIFLLYLLDQMWMHDQIESMPDSLGA